MVELPYKDYFSLRQQADGLSALSGKIESATRELTPFSGKGSDPEPVPAGVKAKQVIDLQEVLGKGSVLKELHANVPVAKPMEAVRAPEPAIAEFAPTAILKGVSSVLVAAEEPEFEKEQGKAPAGVAMTIPQSVVNYITSKDEKGEMMDLFRQYYQELGSSCGGSLSVTLQDRYICLWNYNQWSMFAFWDIHEGCLRLSLNEKFAPEGGAVETWAPPKWMGVPKMIRFEVSAFSKGTLARLLDAFKAA